MNYPQEILNITSAYFEEGVNYSKLKEATDAYKDLLTKLAQVELNNEAGRVDVNSEDGVAIGTFWAALCVDDMMRTRSFLRGIDQAIQEKLKTNSSVHVFYAGTGPFAALILPSIFKYADQDVKYTLLEINQNTIDIYKNVARNLNLEQYNVYSLQGDAIQFQLDPNDSPDIILSETMQNMLVREHQVPIFINLMKQAKEDCIFIPEKVSVSLGFKQKNIPEEQVSKDHFSFRGVLFELSKESFQHWETIQNQKADYVFPTTEINIPTQDLKGYSHAYFLTEIDVLGGEKIYIKESGLTVPMSLGDVNHNKEHFNIQATYVMGKCPELNYEIS